MSVEGVDYAWGRPGAAALKKAGKRFACRYLSHDTTGKNLTLAEARQLSDAGIWVAVVWESGAQRALAGHAAGVADARAALTQAQACGMPAGRPIYFAVDFDAAASQQAAINSYLDGAASVIGRDRVGLYASYYVVRRAFDAHKITWGWQTYAWSGGHWDDRAQIQQYSNDHEINGVGVDYDRATSEDYGQWRVGASPEEEDMALTKDDAQLLLHSSVNASGDTVGVCLQDAKRGVEKLQDGVEQLLDRAPTGGVDVGQLAAALAPLVAAQIAPLVADELAKRLEN